MKEHISGLVEAIYTAPAAGVTPVRHDRVAARPGLGLHGDRYALRVGHWSPQPGSGRDLTLIEAEVVEALSEDVGVVFDAGALRRNIVTRGVRLNELVGVRFRIGSVLVQGSRLCEPCEYLTQILGAPILAPLVHRGGLRVDILTAGEVIEGDRISLAVETAQASASAHALTPYTVQPGGTLDE